MCQWLAEWLTAGTSGLSYTMTPCERYLAMQEPRNNSRLTYVYRRAPSPSGISNKG